MLKQWLCCSVFIILISFCPPDPVQSAKILGIWPMEAPSHFFLGNRLLKELAARGHEVTMISAFPQKTPVKNYRDIVLRGVKEAMYKKLESDGKMNLLDIGDMHPISQSMMTAFVGSMATDITMESEGVQKLLKSNEKFDLVIFEMFFTEVLYGFAHRFNCPVIVLSTIGSSIWTNHLVGNHAPPTYVPDLFTKYSSHMSLVERFQNTAITLVMEFHRKFFYFPGANQKLHKYFPDAPSLDELMYNKTALILLNSHPSISDPKPSVPAMIEIGGFHVNPPKALPKDLKDFMDQAKHGVVLFSMGSNLKSTELTEDMRNALLKAFSKLKQKVIWKWEDENLPGKPDNVKIMKWCPQSDIMAHPNLRLFITHGGLLSTTEAVYHGIPVIAIPIFGDQRMNAAIATRKGFGITINYGDLTEEKLSNALTEILSNPKYKEIAVRGSKILHDQPVKPIDNAVFWTEYVIRHKGAAHLKTAAVDLNWWEIYGFDMILFVIVADLILLVVFYVICKKICGRKQAVDSKKDSKKKKQ